MKKITLTIWLSIIIAALTLPLCTANAHGLLAQVPLNPDLRPEYAVNLQPQGSGQTYAANSGNIILQLVAGSLIYAAGPIAVLMLAVGGLRYVIAHGDQAQMEAAKKNITWAIIGLLVIMVSWLIVSNVIGVVTQAPAASQSAPATTSTPAPAATDKAANTDLDPLAQ
jgi:hypothetical protein